MTRSHGGAPDAGTSRSSVLEWLEDAARDDRGGFVLRASWRRHELSARATAEEAARVAHWLRRRSLAKGDRVIVWGPPGPDWIVGFLGVLGAGAVAVPLDDVAGHSLARRVQEQVKAPLALVGRASLAAAREALAGADIVLLEELRSTVAAEPATMPDLERSASDTMEIVFTSGTTSEPKGVVLTHGNVLANLAPVERAYRRWAPRLRLLRHRPVVVALPLSHAFGQAVGLFAPLMMGATAVFLESPGPGAVRQALRDEKAYALMTVPRLLSALRRDVEAALERQGRLERHLRQRRELAAAALARRWWGSRGVHRRLGWRFAIVIVGGAALDPREEEAWRAMGYLVGQGYGLTETAPIVTLANPFRRGGGVVGKPLPGQEVTLSDEGEVLVRGANVSVGYLRGGKAESLVDDEGWFHTGDLGEWDSKRNLRIVGRLKDVIVTGEGLNVHPGDVERALDRQPGVRESAVIALRAPEGERVHAVLLMEPGAGRDAAERAVKAANESLERYQRVRDFTVWKEPDFPRTSGTRKVRKAALVESISGGRKPEAAMADPIEALLRSRGALGHDARLEDLDLSSLELLELVGRLEDELQVTLDETRVAGLTRVSDLEALLRAGPQRAVGIEPPPMPRWARSRIARALGAALRGLVAYPIVRVACRLRVEGRENVERLDGPALLVASHQSYLDAPVLFRALPRRWRSRVTAATATEPFDPLFRAEGSRLEKAWQRVKWTLVVLAFHSFPLPRAAGFRPSLQYAGEQVDHGFSPLVFPEGRMSRTGELQDFRGGIGILAVELGVPVVPIRIHGLHAVMPVGSRVPRRGDVTVRFGQPLRFGAGTDPRDATRLLEEAMRRA